jgi:hypothetical protein
MWSSSTHGFNRAAMKNVLAAACDELIDIAQKFPGSSSSFQVPNCSPTTEV